MTPLYDIQRTYLENATFGPFFDGPLPERALIPKEQWIDFLGFKIASPIGVPSGPLLNARWIALASALGFDLLTYKTIRSREQFSHPLPNVVFVDSPHQLDTSDEKPLYMRTTAPKSVEDLAITNSFGNPSRTPEFLQQDISKAQSCLKEGQLLIISIYGETRQEIGYKEDFVAAARFAKEAGAQIIEANFSCPNVHCQEGSLYLSPEAVYETTKAIVETISPLPLIIKMGVFPSPEWMRKVMLALARGGARALCGINTISRTVLSPDNTPALGAHRTKAGICGNPIRNAALDFVRSAAEINWSEKLALTLMGCGGIVAPEHFNLFLEAGADAALTATGMMWHPYLAQEYHSKYLNSLTST